MIFSLKGFIYEAPCGFFTFSMKNSVLLSSATGPGYGRGVDVNTASKLEINEVYLPERPSSLAVRHAAHGSPHSGPSFPTALSVRLWGTSFFSAASPQGGFRLVFLASIFLVPRVRVIPESLDCVKAG